MNASLVAATLVNIHRRKGARPVSPKDFLADESRDKRHLTVEQSRAVLQGLAASLPRRKVQA